MFSIIIGILIACWMIGIASTMIWVALCYLTPYLTPLVERLFEWAVSTDSKVKSLSERLKSNDTPKDSKPKDIHARMQDIKNKLIAQNILLLEAKENLEKANKRMKSC